MLVLVIALTVLAVALGVIAVAEFVPNRDRAITRKLSELEEIASQRTIAQKRRRQTKREQLEVWLENLGEAVSPDEAQLSKTRRKLITAGFRDPRAVPMFYGMRVVAPIIAVLLYVSLFAPALEITGGFRYLFWMIVAAGAGFMMVNAFLSRRVRLRKKEIQKALPDTLDMLVVCVEAGLGLNQALARVSEEVEHISTIMSEELQIVGLEIRAGTPREDALRHLGERTDVKDIKGLVSMLIQTDRFGTSIAQALRVHSDDLRTKRRQRAEEAAAKTTIKLVIPLAIFVFPAMFVVILGPAILVILEQFGSIGS
ncbi:MAG TPA: type II secretion system F family protein [Alphaproteobacteria bacterium]|nr:type II secretion system F family protein [Alphaproteobacteria bacterium]